MRKVKRFSGLMVVLVILSLLVSACGGSKQSVPSSTSTPSPATEQPKQLTVAIFGGAWGDAVKKHVIESFEKKYNVKVLVEVGTSTVTLAKLQQQKANPTLDVALMDSGISELAYAEKLVQPIDTTKLSNFSQLMPEGVYKDGDKVWALDMGYWALGILYNKDKVKTPPTSWVDLWKPEYAGKLTIPAPATTSGLPLLVQISKMNGGGLDKIDPGFAAVKKLKVAAYFESSGAASNLFQSGEVVIGAHYGGPSWALVDQGLPLVFVAPKEGALAADSRWHLVSGTKNADLAYKFLDMAISAEAQKGIAEDLYIAPVNKNVQLSDKAKQRMPFGPNGTVKDLSFPDYAGINKNRPAWNDRWAKEIANK